MTYILGERQKHEKTEIKSQIRTGCSSNTNDQTAVPASASIMRYNEKR